MFCRILPITASAISNGLVTELIGEAVVCACLRRRVDGGALRTLLLATESCANGHTYAHARLQRISSWSSSIYFCAPSLSAARCNQRGHATSISQWSKMGRRRKSRKIPQKHTPPARSGAMKSMTHCAAMRYVSRHGRRWCSL